jgi:transcriptional regulator with XRE-family HTH domain
MSIVATISDNQAKLRIAANCRRLRADRSFAEIARACSTDEWKCYPATIQQVESGQHMPGAGLLARLAEALECTPNDLLAAPPEISRVAS